MAMTFTQSGPRRPGLATVEVFGRLVASGNYSTGGDTVDFTALGSYWRSKDPLFVEIQGKAGFVYQYDVENKKVLVYSNTAGGANAPLGEHTAAAYAAGVTGDVIRVRMVMAK
jgi:hypothetical protein